MSDTCVASECSRPACAAGSSGGFNVLEGSPGPKFLGQREASEGHLQPRTRAGADPGAPLTGGDVVSLAGPGSSTFALPTSAAGRWKSPAACQSCLWDCSSALGSVTLCSLPYPSSEALRVGVWVLSAPGIVLKTSNISGSGSHSLPPFGEGLQYLPTKRPFSSVKFWRKVPPIPILKNALIGIFFVGWTLVWDGCGRLNTLFVHSLISPRESMRLAATVLKAQSSVVKGFEPQARVKTVLEN